MTNPSTSAPNSPQQLFALLVSELSASGNTALTAATKTVPAPNLTMRGAIGAILWVTNAAVDMKGTGSSYGPRPWPATIPDTLLGHTLDIHGIALQNQALLLAIAEKVGVTNPSGILTSAITWG